MNYVAGVMNTGTLAKAGDKVVGGDVVGIRPGHILKPFERDNLHTGKREMFDPVQVRCSRWPRLGSSCCLFCSYLDSRGQRRILMLLFPALNFARCSCHRCWSTACTHAMHGTQSKCPAPLAMLTCLWHDTSMPLIMTLRSRS
jgi:hypothetical protein